MLIFIRVGNHASILIIKIKNKHLYFNITYLSKKNSTQNTVGLRYSKPGSRKCLKKSNHDYSQNVAYIHFILYFGGQNHSFSKTS